MQATLNTYAERGPTSAAGINLPLKKRVPATTNDEGLARAIAGERSATNAFQHSVDVLLPRLISTLLRQNTEVWTERVFATNYLNRHEIQLKAKLAAEKAKRAARREFLRLQAIRQQEEAEARMQAEADSDDEEVEEAEEAPVIFASPARGDRLRARRGDAPLVSVSAEQEDELDRAEQQLPSEAPLEEEEGEEHQGEEKEGKEEEEGKEEGAVVAPAKKRKFRSAKEDEEAENTEVEEDASYDDDRDGDETEEEDDEDEPGLPAPKRAKPMPVRAIVVPAPTPLVVPAPGPSSVQSSTGLVAQVAAMFPAYTAPMLHEDVVRPQDMVM
jgi:hypothetical protein